MIAEGLGRFELEIVERAMRSLVSRMRSSAFVGETDPHFVAVRELHEKIERVCSGGKKPNECAVGVRFDEKAFEFVLWTREDDGPTTEIRLGASSAIGVVDFMVRKIRDFGLRQLVGEREFRDATGDR